MGPKTLQLVNDHADWWNLHTGALHRLAELRDQVPRARVSIQQMVTYIADESERDEVTALAVKRFGRNGPVIGSANELIDHYGRSHEQGIDRFYAWFTDFAKPETLAAFGETVIAQLA